jgi:preprotein translocase subunit YajC
MSHVELQLSSTALAQTEGAPAARQPSTIETMLPFALMIVVFFFLVIRPQQKKAKEHAQLLTGLKPGDEVVTTGGIIGKVRSVAETFVTIEAGPNTTLKVLKANVTSLTTKPAAAPAGKEAPAKG